MRHTLTIMTAVFLAGCAHRNIIRDSNTYQAELNQYDNWATQQAKYLRSFIEEHCECEAGKFADKDCADAADYVLTIEARHAWHKSMSLWNASLIEEEPAQEPPAIAPLTCPLPSAPTE